MAQLKHKRSAKISPESDKQQDKRHKGGDVLSQLECAVCMSTPIFPPIRQCPNGHILCDACSKKPQCHTCPQCRAHPTSIRCLALGKAAESLDVACPYADKGCTKVCQYLETEKHARKCDFKPFGCPLRCEGGRACMEMLTAQANAMLDHFIQIHTLTVAGNASEETGGLLLEYKKDDLQRREHRGSDGSKKEWKERLVVAAGLHFLVRVVEVDDVYQISVKGLAADSESVCFDCMLSAEDGRRQLIWKGPIHGLTLGGHNHAADRMCIHKEWANKAFKGEHTLIVHLVIKRAPK